MSTGFFLQIHVEVLVLLAWIKNPLIVHFLYIQKVRNKYV